MKVLSLFDGMSVAQQALKNIGADVEVYYASEIDEYAMAVTQSNFPNTVQMGDICGIKGDGNELFANWGESPHGDVPMFRDARYRQCDILIGGSPCQDLSIAKKGREGLSGSRSGLFWEYVRIRDEVKPKYFILENVNSMPKEAKDTISEALGVQPVMINASLVSAQNRKRLFWVGKYNGEKYEQVEIPQPEDRGILLKDILEDSVNESYSVYNKKLSVGKASTLGSNPQCLTAKTGQGIPIRIGSFNSGGQGDRIYSQDGKSVSLSANGGGRGAKTGLYEVRAITMSGTFGNRRVAKSDKAYCLAANPSSDQNPKVEIGTQIRKLTPIECLRLQSMPDDYFDKATYKNKPISNTQRYKMCGNAFNCKVIEHILKEIIVDKSIVY